MYFLVYSPVLDVYETMYFSVMEEITDNLAEYSLLGISPAPDVYKPTFRNSMSVPSSWVDKNEVPKDYILHSQHGESLQTTIQITFIFGRLEDH
jgi:hypothetical protein